MMSFWNRLQRSVGVADTNTAGNPTAAPAPGTGIHSRPTVAQPQQQLAVPSSADQAVKSSDTASVAPTTAATTTTAAANAANAAAADQTAGQAATTQAAVTPTNNSNNNNHATNTNNAAQDPLPPAEQHSGSLISEASPPPAPPPPNVPMIRGINTAALSAATTGGGQSATPQTSDRVPARTGSVAQLRAMQLMMAHHHMQHHHHQHLQHHHQQQHTPIMMQHHHQFAMHHQTPQLSDRPVPPPPPPLPPQQNQQQDQQQQQQLHSLNNTDRANSNNQMAMSHSGVYLTAPRVPSTLPSPLSAHLQQQQSHQQQQQQLSQPGSTTTTTGAISHHVSPHVHIQPSASFHGGGGGTLSSTAMLGATTNSNTVGGEGTGTGTAASATPSPPHPRSSSMVGGGNVPMTPRTIARVMEMMRQHNQIQQHQQQQQSQNQNPQQHPPAPHVPHHPPPPPVPHHLPQHQHQHQHHQQSFPAQSATSNESHQQQPPQQQQQQQPTAAAANKSDNPNDMSIESVAAAAAAAGGNEQQQTQQTQPAPAARAIPASPAAVSAVPASPAAAITGNGGDEDTENRFQEESLNEGTGGGGQGGNAAAAASPGPVRDDGALLLEHSHKDDTEVPAIQIVPSSGAASGAATPHQHNRSKARVVDETQLPSSSQPPPMATARKSQATPAPSQEQQQHRKSVDTSATSNTTPVLSPIRQAAQQQQKAKQQDQQREEENQRGRAQKPQQQQQQQNQQLHLLLPTASSSSSAPQFYPRIPLRRNAAEIHDAVLRLLASNQPNGKPMLVTNVRLTKQQQDLLVEQDNDRDVDGPSSFTRRASLELLYCVQTSQEMQLLLNHGFDSLAKTSAASQLSASMFLSVPHSRPAPSSSSSSSAPNVSASKNQKSNNSNQSGERLTTFALCRVDPGRVRFCLTGSDANEHFASGTADTCFVVESGCVAVSRPSLVHVEAVADVLWTPYSALAPLMCETHTDTELILFDLQTQKLACPICVATGAAGGGGRGARRNGAGRNTALAANTAAAATDYLVLTDLFGGSDGGAQVASKLEEAVETLCRTRLPQSIADHSLIASAATRRRAAIESQFQLLQTALNAKKAELLDQLTEQERAATKSISRDILTYQDAARHAANALAVVREAAASPPRRRDQAQQQQQQPQRNSHLTIEQLICVANSLHAAAAVVPSLQHQSSGGALSFLRKQTSNTNSNVRRQSTSAGYFASNNVAFDTLLSSPHNSNLLTTSSSRNKQQQQTLEDNSVATSEDRIAHRIASADTAVEFEGKFHLETDAILRAVNDLAFRARGGSGYYRSSPHRRRASSVGGDSSTSGTAGGGIIAAASSSFSSFQEQAQQGTSSRRQQLLQQQRVSPFRRANSAMGTRINRSGMSNNSNNANSSNSVRFSVDPTTVKQDSSSLLLAGLPQFAPPKRRAIAEKHAVATDPNTAAALGSLAGSGGLLQLVVPINEEEQSYLTSHMSTASFGDAHASPSSSYLTGAGGVHAARSHVNIFDVPLHLLFTGKPRTVVEWTLRVDDPGECLAVGACVGAPIELIQSGMRPVDTRHMCVLVAPPTRRIRVRLSLGPHGAVKLSVFDGTGRQIDDGKVAHWPQGKMAYPAVSTGIRAGAVVLVKAPEVVASG